jgi:hypothetical protein
MGTAVVRVALAVLVALFAIATPSRAKASFDPALRFYTIETPHFRITYHTGIEEVAQRVASTAESIYRTMTAAVGHVPDTKTEIVITDTAESANGSASALPYNAIHLLVTAPEDMSPLGDVDDWYLELVSHEYTHILHTDQIHGLPAIVNAVLGKTLAPNQVQPRWILEGYAVYEETTRTSGGRLQNSMWDMFMRTDVLENNVASLDEISNIVRRWPQGNLFYLYGSFFIDWIARTYGEQTFREVARDYGGQFIPWGIQRTIRRYTGKTYDELYPLWIESMKRQYGQQAAAVRREGLREGIRITHHAQNARYPRWIPNEAWPEHRGGLLYYRDDNHDRAGLFALDLVRDAAGNVRVSRERDADLIARTNTETYTSFLPDGGIVFGAAEFYKNYFLFGELERIASGGRSRFGTPDGGRTPVTDPALRAADPATSPDGRRIVYTRNSAGTRSIHIANFDDAGLHDSRPLVPTAFLEQAFTPRWSPDGSHVAYSVWKDGGYRDIRYVDVASGTFRDLTNDRAVDGAPSFSADGKWLFFHSDRTGITNVYAYELKTGNLKQVTNVISGAYSPEPSPDGKTVAYVGYGKDGFDLYAMPLDENTWPDAPDYVDDHPPRPRVEQRRWESKPYSPWHTLLPRFYGVQITQGSFGESVIVNTLGTDVTGLHAIEATINVEIEKPELQGSLGYSYGGLPVDFSAGLSRSLAPRAGYQIGQYKPTIVQETAGVSTSLSYSEPTAYDSRGYVVTHALNRVAANFPMPADKIDPYETPVFPARGLASTIHLGYNYANAERYLWSVGPERGFAFNLGVDVTDPILGSDFSGFAVNGDFMTYVLMPWLSHHSLALHAGGGTSGGSFPGRGAFYVGGFVDLPVVDTIRKQLIQGGITLRGYEPVTLAGRSYALTNAEYRFPILNLDRGDSTLPIFLERITGAAFIDYGSAFDTFRDAQFKTGVGAELWFDLMLGYVAPFTFRIGYARGLASHGIDKPYFVAAIPF